MGSNPVLFWFFGISLIATLAYLTLYVFARVRRAEPGKRTFFITDIWAFMLGISPTLWLISQIVKSRNETAASTLYLEAGCIAGLLWCQVLGAVWGRLWGPVVRRETEPQRLEQAALVFWGTFSGGCLFPAATLFSTLMAVLVSGIYIFSPILGYGVLLLALLYPVIVFKLWTMK